MAEARVEEITEVLEGTTLGQKKKKKCRSKPGRRYQLKERVMVREFWLAEKEAEAKNGPHAKWGVDEEHQKKPSPSGIKLFHPSSSLFDAYLHMEENFCCKVSKKA